MPLTITGTGSLSIISGGMGILCGGIDIQDEAELSLQCESVGIATYNGDITIADSTVRADIASGIGFYAGYGNTAGNVSVKNSSVTIICGDNWGPPVEANGSISFTNSEAVMIGAADEADGVLQFSEDGTLYISGGWMYLENTAGKRVLPLSQVDSMTATDSAVIYYASTNPSDYSTLYCNQIQQGNNVQFEGCHYDSDTGKVTNVKAGYVMGDVVWNDNILIFSSSHLRMYNWGIGGTSEFMSDCCLTIPEGVEVIIPDESGGGESIEIKDGGSIINNGTLTVNRAISNKAGGAFINNGMLNIEDVDDDSVFFENYSTFENNGTVNFGTSYKGGFLNYQVNEDENGSITNNGTMNGVVSQYSWSENSDYVNETYIACGDAVLMRNVTLGVNSSGDHIIFQIPEDAALTIPDGVTLDATQNGVTVENLTEYLSVEGEIVVEEGGQLLLPDGYLVEHYKISDDGYVLADREYVAGTVGETVKAEDNLKEYEGYSYTPDAEGTVAEVTLTQITSPADLLTLKIYYDLTVYNVTVETGEGGTASASPESATMGGEITLTAEAGEGYHFKEWQVVSGDVTIGDDNKFTMPINDVTVKAVFETCSADTFTDHGDGTHTGPCDVCGETITEAHKYENGVCIVCGQVCAHSFNTDGVCTICGNQAVASAVVEVNGTYIYDGSEQVPADSEITVRLNGVILSASDYEVTCSDNVDAGTATITITGKGKYTGTATGSFTIHQLQPTIAFNSDYPNTVIYSGMALADPTEAQMAIEGAAYGDVKFTWSDTPIGAGTYNLTATIEETTNAKAATATIPVTISPKEVTATVKLNETSLEYTGSEIKPSVTVWDGDTEIDASEYMVFYANNVSTGTAAVTITDNAGGNYIVSGSADFEITNSSLETADVTVSGSFTYNGTAHTPDVTVVKNGVTVDSGEYTVSYADNINAGTASVTIMAKDGGNYAGSRTVEFEIQKATLTAVISGKMSKTYDGTTDAPEGLFITLTGVFGTDAVTAEAKSYAYDTADAGENKIITATGITISGEDEENYTLSAATAEVSGEIERKSIAGAVVTLGDPLTYTGGEQTQSVESVTLDGLTVTFGVSDNTGINAGNYTLKITGTENFTGTVTESWSIAKRAISVVADSGQSKEYGAEDPELTYTITSGSLVDSHTLTFYRVEGENVGTYEINGFTITDADGADVLGNYTGGFTSDVFTITVASLANAEIALSQDSYTYDGTEHEPTVTVTKDGKKVDANEYTVSYADNKNAGTASVTITAKENGNYAGSRTVEFTIRQKEIPVTITPGGGVFGGTITEAAAELAGVVEGDTVDVILTYTGTANDGTEVNDTTAPILAGTYTVTATIADGNYTLTGGNTVAFAVEKASVGLSVSPVENPTYGSSEFILDATAVSDGTIRFESSDENVLTVDETGTVTIVSVGEATIAVSVDETVNYHGDSKEVTITVNPKPITITADDKSKVYGEDMPKLTWSITEGALVSGDTLNGIEIQCENSGDAGEYAITVSQAKDANPNYAITFVNGTLTIEKKDISDENGDVDIEKGTIGVTVRNETGAPQTELKTDEAAIIAMLVANGGLAAEELALVAEGADIHIILKVTNADDTITEESKAQIEKAVKGYTIGRYIDISLFKRLMMDGEAGELVQITGTHDSITISLQVPDDLLNTNSSVTRTFWIVRNHEGVVEFLPTTYDAETNALIFDTDKFSDYAIVYQDTQKATQDTEHSGEDAEESAEGASQPNNTAIGTAPQTGDDSQLWLILLILSCGGLIGMVIYGRRKKSGA